LSYNDFNESTLSEYKIRTFTFTNGKYINSVTGVLSYDLDTVNTELGALPIGGWKNPYLCT
jgi:hypothetical protein